MGSVLKLLKNPAKIVYILDRLKIGRLIPDKLYLKMKYQSVFGRKLNLKDPQTFNEKLQWLKLYNRNPEYTKLVDKCDVKFYVAEKIGEEYIIPTLGVWDSVEEIDFDVLPDQFVLKCTHDSGGLVICRNKSSFDIENAKAILNKAFKNEFYYDYREWPYKNVRHRIMAEVYMEDSQSEDASAPKGLVDYKFYCFNGEPRFLYVSKGLEDHSTAAISFLTLDWQFAPYVRSDFATFKKLPPKPVTFEHMLEISRMLSAGIDFVRVDLYEIEGKVFFSELTFFPCAGLMVFQDPAHDREVGNMLKLTEK